MNLKRPVILIQNNTAVTQPVNLFTINPNASGGINATKQYQWDISSLILNQLTDLQLQVGSAGTPGFSTLSMVVVSSTVSAIVNALNGLNVGLFRSIVTGGTTLIVTNNKAFTFGNLLINQPPQNPHWITTGGVQINNPGVTASASIQSNDTRSAIILSGNGDFGVLTPPFFLPYVFNLSSYALGTLLTGDPVQTVIDGGPGGPLTIQLILKQNGIVILNNTQIGSPAVFNFTYLFNAVYDFNATIN